MMAKFSKLFLTIPIHKKDNESVQKHVKVQCCKNALKVFMLFPLASVGIPRGRGKGAFAPLAFKKNLIKGSFLSFWFLDYLGYFVSFVESQKISKKFARPPPGKTPLDANASLYYSA